MEKSAEAFRTISEVADILQTPAHVLRFWESRFPQIKPVKRAGGRRYYRPSDIALLSGIRHLLHEQGMTIRGVQKILREQGVRHVTEISSVEEAGFVEVEVEDVPQTAEVHAFPQKADRAPAAEIDPRLVGWEFTPSEDGDDFFAQSAETPLLGDEAPPSPLSTSDTLLARERAERLREQDPPMPDTLPARAPLILRLLALDPDRARLADVAPVHARLNALRARLQDEDR
ncbi:MerR family transcriptional regulator [Falsirhodobacter algicola]|uniref:MerR family transcriptional regulator n=1 Tax=Falsirhodobacter algicola TaxID=2692330 RepID=A0A8J8MSQ3_9RHOB|nr:MerR family transcriptional regulator [Falsirhodobacter algicola]QUS35603.1 MerR family transcriptional regulator [Falsirhodobacter algicola]